MMMVATGKEIVHRGMRVSDFQIAAVVDMSPHKTAVNIGGKVSAVIDVAAPKWLQQAYGDSRAQTVSALTQFLQLYSIGLTMSDVVNMQTSQYGDPALGGEWILPVS